MKAEHKEEMIKRLDDIKEDYWRALGEEDETHKAQAFSALCQFVAELVCEVPTTD